MSWVDACITRVNVTGAKWGNVIVVCLRKGLRFEDGGSHGIPNHIFSLWIDLDRGAAYNMATELQNGAPVPPFQPVSCISIRLLLLMMIISLALSAGLEDWRKARAECILDKTCEKHSKKKQHSKRAVMALYGAQNRDLGCAWLMQKQNIVDILTSMVPYYVLCFLKMHPHIQIRGIL